MSHSGVPGLPALQMIWRIMSLLLEYWEQIHKLLLKSSISPQAVQFSFTLANSPLAADQIRPQKRVLLVSLIRHLHLTRMHR